MMCFFFQAEDGIRDWSVTGVQTCALPILADMNLWKGCPAGHQKIWNICSICRQVGDRPTRSDEFSEASPALFKMLPECSQSDRESAVGEFHRAAVLFPEPATFQQGGVPQSAAF